MSPHAGQRTFPRLRVPCAMRVRVPHLQRISFRSMGSSWISWHALQKAHWIPFSLLDANWKCGWISKVVPQERQVRHSTQK